MPARLTRRTLDAWLKSPSGNAWLWCGELRGFGAHRRDAGQAAFLAQFRVGRGRTARRRRVVLGTYPVMTPEEARERAAGYITAGWGSIDLVAQQQAEQAKQTRQIETIECVIEAFHAGRRLHLKPQSFGQYEALWQRLILPCIGNKAVADVRRREIAALMDSAEQLAGPSVADRIHEQLDIFFRWYAQRDDEFSSPLVRTLKRHRKGPGASHMTDDELRQFWRACGNAGIAGAAGRFCLLTATRRNETVRAVWPELSDTSVWTIPSERYKTNRPHSIPLSQAARAVVEGLDRASPYVFGLTERAPDPWYLWTTIVDAGGPSGDGVSWHSLRKTARTLMSRAGVRSDHAERALGHVQGVVERAYDKHSYLPEKRSVFDALADEIARVIDRRSTNNVIPLQWHA